MNGFTAFSRVFQSNQAEGFVVYNEKLGAIEPGLWLKRVPLVGGLEPGPLR